MGARATTAALVWLLASCGGGQAAVESSDDTGEGAPAGATGAPPAAEAEDSHPWLARLEESHVLTYRVTLADAEEPVEVLMQVQQRVAHGDAVAVRLTPIGTPLGETPVYPQWLVGTPDGLSGLDETAALTTPGFVPIDESGEMRTEAASNQTWRIEERWLHVGAATSGTEAAIGWTLAERLGTIREPFAASDCVRLEREDATATTTLVACADVGVVERQDVAGEEVRAHWQLVSIGEREAQID